MYWYIHWLLVVPMSRTRLVNETYYSLLGRTRLVNETYYSLLGRTRLVNETYYSLLGHQDECV